MVTKDRDALAEEAIRCYRNQTYINKELVIVAQGTTESNRKLRTHVGDDPAILMVEVASTISLAAIRNLSVGIARGEYICQWDDDDLYHPARIATHMSKMNDAVASTYTQHLKLFGKDLYWIDWSQEPLAWQQMLCGAILFRKSAYRHFKSLLYPEFTEQQHKEEDLNVLKNLFKLGHVTPLTQGHQYIYRFHGKNVYDLAHHKLVLDKVVMKPAELLANRELLEATFKSVGLREAVVRDRESIAFHYSNS